MQILFGEAVRKIFCNKSSNEEPGAASTDDSRLNSDSDRLFELFWIQAASQGHTS